MDKNIEKSNILLVRPRVYINDNISLGPGKIDILRAIDGFNSLSAAAKDLGIPYKRAWLLVDTLNKGIGKPVVTTATGGAKEVVLSSLLLVEKFYIGMMRSRIISMSNLNRS
ncbi:LysR family transcriptional regulator [Edwardsiella tarda]